MTTVRVLTPSEQYWFRLARMAAVEMTPYFAHAVFAMTPLAAEGLGTFAVDRAWRLYMDPSLLTEHGEWSSGQAGAVLVHEVNHLLREHAARADAVDTVVDRLRWNYAADAEINDDLLGAGLVLPEGVVTPEALGASPGDCAEVYYRMLSADPAFCEPPDLVGGDDGGCGSGAGERTAPWEVAADGEAGSTPGLSAADAEMVRKATARAVTEAAGRGTVPAGVQRWASEALAPAQVRWQKVLSAAVRRAVGQQSGNLTRSFRRLSRHSRSDVLLPAWRAPNLTVDVVVDTSGSMSGGDLTAALSEVSGVLKTVTVSRVRVGCCDAESTVLQPVRSSSDVVLVGGGGTDMRVGIAAALGQSPRSSIIVVMTDGDTPWPERYIGVPMIAVLIGAGEQQRKQVPNWAKTVMVPSGVGA